MQNNFSKKIESEIIESDFGYKCDVCDFFTKICTPGKPTVIEYNFSVLSINLDPNALF